MNNQQEALFLANNINQQVYFKPRNMVLKTYFRNELRNTSMPLLVMKVRDYIISKLDPDELQSIIIVDAKEFYANQGITKIVNRHYELFENALEYLLKTPCPIILFNTETGDYRTITAPWVVCIESIGNIASLHRQHKVHFNPQVAKKMFEDKDLLPFPLNSSRITSKYGYLLHELLWTMGIFGEPVRFELEELAARLDASAKLEALFSDFRIDVIDPAVKSINAESSNMEFFKPPVYEKEGRKYKYVTFWPRKCINDINFNEVEPANITHAVALDDICSRIKFDELVQKTEDQQSVLFAAKVLQSAYDALAQPDTLLFEKFNLTKSEMQTSLDNMTMANILDGLLAIKNLNEEESKEGLLLRSIMTSYLKAQKSKKSALKKNANNSPLLSSTVTESATKSPAPKRARATKEQMNAARSRARQQISYDFLKVFVCDISHQGSQENVEIAIGALDDLVDAIVYVLTTNTPSITIRGKKSDKAETLFTHYIREIFESDALNSTVAQNVLNRYLEVYDDLKYVDKAKSRQRYLLTMLWNELMSPAQESYEDDYGYDSWRE